MSLLHSLRLALRKTGMDVSRYPAESAEFHATEALMACQPQLVLDVGAHRGAFADQCRAMGYVGPIVSFEPVAALAADLRRRAAGASAWHVVQAAAGQWPGRAVLHVAGNDAASSSLLPMLARHRQAAPESGYVADESVEVVRLDEWLSANAPAAHRLALKLDVQGAEQAALAGLGERIDDVAGLRLELSVQPLYEGGWDWLTACRWLDDRGFGLVGVVPGFRDRRSGEMLQFDAVFTR